METAGMNVGAFKFYIPDEFDIKIWMDENGKYHMSYTEGLKMPKKMIDTAAQMTLMALDKVLSTEKGVDDYNISYEIKDKVYVHIEIIGDETSIFNYLVGEFIGRSSFGKASIGQVMMMLLDVPLGQAIAEMAVRKIVGNVVQVIKPQADKSVEEAREKFYKKLEEVKKEEHEDKLATEEQISFIERHYLSMGPYEDIIKSYMISIGKDNFNQLTSKEADEIIERLKHVKKQK